MLTPGRRIRCRMAYENWPVMPAVLYKGMLAPVAPLAITGAIWYQGEQNSPRGYQYRKILPAMIADWRQTVRAGRFSVLHCQPARFYASAARRRWTATSGRRRVNRRRLRRQKCRNSCLAVTIDTGEADNIHPKEKKPVGDRLALCALAKYYGKNLVYSGPTLESVKRLPGAIRLHLKHTDGGLAVKGDKLEEFSIAGDDRKWFWGDARIEGDTIVVSSPSVPNPTQIRYAWQSNPAATLFNGAGLPRCSFPYR